MSSNDDGPPPSEDEVNGSDEEVVSNKCKVTPSDTVPDEVSSVNITEPKCSTTKPKQRSVKSPDSLEDFDPDDPPKPMTVIKVPKKYEKFTTKIKLQAAPRTKGAAPNDATSSKKPKEKSFKSNRKDKSKSSKKPKVATNSKPASMKTNEPTTKGQSKKKSTRAEGKSVRKPAKTAVDTIKQIISDMDYKTETTTEQSTTSPACSITPPSVNTRSILPEPKARAKVMNKTKSYKAKAKTMTIKNHKDKSRFSSRVNGPAKDKQPEQKKNSVKKSNQSSGSSDPSPAPKAAPDSKFAECLVNINSIFISFKFTVHTITDQIKKMDPNAAKVLEKYWPELVSAFQNQSEPTGKTNQPVAPLTNDEMEDLNDEVTF